MKIRVTHIINERICSHSRIIGERFSPIVLFKQYIKTENDSRRAAPHHTAERRGYDVDRCQAIMRKVMEILTDTTVSAMSMLNNEENFIMVARSCVGNIIDYVSLYLSDQVSRRDIEA